MDPINLAFYAAVCGLLAAFGPALGGLWSRIVVGIVVGMIASATLPFLKGWLGLG